MDANNEETNGHYPNEKDRAEVNDDEESDDNLVAKTPLEPVRQNELTSGPLSPGMQELAQIVGPR